MLSISMLGRMSVTAQQRRLPLDLGPSGRLMAGYLFEFPGRAHRREHLSEMFWNDRSQAQARAAMNTALWRLRKLLAADARHEGDAGLLTSGDEVVFEPRDWIVIDTHDFDTAVRRALTGDAGQSTQQRTRMLEEAARRYVGCFLEGDDVDWVIAERERLHSLYVRCLSQMARYFAAESDFEPAIEATRRVLAADPFRETVMRTLCLLLFLNGQRAQAITELRRWQLALRNQVGVDALPETLALGAALVSGDICAEIEQWRASHLTAARSERFN